MSAAGRTATLAFNTGTFASPVWVEAHRATEVKRPSSRAGSDRKYRGAKNVKTVAGYIKTSITFKYQQKRAGVADAVFTLLQSRFLSGEFIDVAALSQKLTAPTGSPAIGTPAVGDRGPYVVLKFDRDENDEDGISYDVELAETDEDKTGGGIWDVEAYSINVVAAS